MNDKVIMDNDTGKSRIPSLRRSASVRVRGEKMSPNTGLFCGGPNNSRQSIASMESHNCHHPCGDSESLKSHGSNTSLASCGSSQQTAGDKGSCSHGRRNKFVLHCQRHCATPQETYLTPTQRKDRELRSLRTALAQATRDAEDKSLQLHELSREIERLRHDRPLTPHSEAGASQSGGSIANGDTADIEAVACRESGSEQASRYTPKQVQTDDDIRCASSVSTFVQTTERDCPSSLHSNHGLVTEPHEEVDLYGDDIRHIRMSWINSNLSTDVSKKDEATGDDDDDYDATDLRRKYRDLRQRYNDRTENLLQMLSDLNAKKGKEAAKFEHDEDGLYDAGERQRASGPTMSPLLQQLRRTERELERTRELYSVPQRPAIHGIAGDRQAEYTLRFLKDAVFYFLTDRTDFRGHLNAIQSILGFSEAERAAVAKVWRNRGRL
ncbi:protein quick-to-court-like isoform X3 [Ornithodoros turicata]|uniref:protein quick-to-court-like isoform X3 n=1 Tax=Ornithodoros turicata TaxID=34597 RepID=UPI0031398F66